MPARTLTITHEVGLHARPAATFVKTASGFPCEVTIRNVTSGSDAVNAKSILSVLTLGVNQNHEIEIAAEGEQADDALDALTQLVENNFGE